MQNEIFVLLAATEDRIIDMVRSRMVVDQGISPGILQRVERLTKSIARIRSKAWTDIQGTWVSDLQALAKQESEFAAKLLQGTELKAKDLRFLTLEKPFEGKTITNWANDLAAADAKRIRDQLRISLVQRESGAIAAERVRRVLDISKRNAETITRTAVNAVAGGVREAIIVAKGFKRELYVAILDSRTTAICRSLDGKIFLVGKGPIPPIHWGCRSIRVPLLTGKVPGRQTYREWLKKQPRSVQIDILGPTRAKLFREGNLSLDSFVDRKGKLLTLRELAREDSAAFRRAGLTPEDFLD